ncbi:hypothetical protein Tco_0824566 [Tanacetum coccineum]|uniref:Uncharacterized protein n=1 Tax=Tanacetum coccineum TaxID=301880 RepID=A0ABQ5AP43_9ASTR
MSSTRLSTNGVIVNMNSFYGMDYRIIEAGIPVSGTLFMGYKVGVGVCWLLVVWSWDRVCDSCRSFSGSACGCRVMGFAGVEGLGYSAVFLGLEREVGGGFVIVWVGAKAMGLDSGIKSIWNPWSSRRRQASPGKLLQENLGRLKRYREIVVSISFGGRLPKSSGQSMLWMVLGHVVWVGFGNSATRPAVAPSLAHISKSLRESLPSGPEAYGSFPSAANLSCCILKTSLCTWMLCVNERTLQLCSCADEPGDGPKPLGKHMPPSSTSLLSHEVYQIPISRSSPAACLYDTLFVDPSIDLFQVIGAYLGAASGGIYPVILNSLPTSLIPCRLSSASTVLKLINLSHDSGGGMYRDGGSGNAAVTASMRAVGCYQSSSGFSLDTQMM